MITILNRKELCITFSKNQKIDIIKVLKAANIDFKIKSINRNSSSQFQSNRGRIGTLGQNLNLETEYIIYVRSVDIEQARSVINEIYN